MKLHTLAPGWHATRLLSQICYSCGHVVSGITADAVVAAMRDHCDYAGHLVTAVKA